MKATYIKYLISDLMKNKDYMPITGEDGHISDYEHAVVLERKNWSAVYIIELLDGDYYTADEILGRMEHRLNAVTAAGGSLPITFSEVFIFKDEIPPEKLEVIKAMQRVMLREKRFLISFSIQLGSMRVLKYSQSPGNADKLEDVLKRSLQSHSGQPEPELEVLLAETFESRQKEQAQLEQVEGKPVFTYLFLAANILMWLVTEYYNRVNNTSTGNLFFGAKFNPLIMGGEYWRLITPMFLHGGFLHLFVNSYSLYAIGPTVEKLYGSRKFIAIYLTAGIFGNIASFIFSPSISVGASGALFGLLGALLYMGQKHKRLFRSSFGTGVITTIIFNIGFGLTQPGIDNFAHIGGLVGGYLAALAVGLVYEKAYTKKGLAIWVVIITAGLSGIYAGFHMPVNIELKNAYEQYLKSRT